MLSARDQYPATFAIVARIEREATACRDRARLAGLHRENHETGRFRHPGGVSPGDGRSGLARRAGRGGRGQPATASPLPIAAPFAARKPAGRHRDPGFAPALQPGQHRLLLHRPSVVRPPGLSGYVRQTADGARRGVCRGLRRRGGGAARQLAAGPAARPGRGVAPQPPAIALRRRARADHRRGAGVGLSVRVGGRQPMGRVAAAAQRAVVRRDRANLWSRRQLLHLPVARVRVCPGLAGGAAVRSGGRPVADLCRI